MPLPSALFTTRLAAGLGSLALLPLIGASSLGPLARTLASAAPAASAGATVAEFPEKEAFFGETHVHTAYSFDAFLGGSRLEPDGAYRFARGEEVEVSGQRFRLRRPLDWAAVTDHAEFLGEMETILQSEAPGHNDPTVKELRGLTHAGGTGALVSQLPEGQPQRQARPPALLARSGHGRQRLAPQR
jgi:hypothetical protein